MKTVRRLSPKRTILSLILLLGIALLLVSLIARVKGSKSQPSDARLGSDPAQVRTKTQSEMAALHREADRLGLEINSLRSQYFESTPAVKAAHATYNYYKSWQMGVAATETAYVNGLLGNKSAGKQFIDDYMAQRQVAIIKAIKELEEDPSASEWVNAYAEYLRSSDPSAVGPPAHFINGDPPLDLFAGDIRAALQNPEKPGEAQDRASLPEELRKYLDDYAHSVVLANSSAYYLQANKPPLLAKKEMRLAELLKLTSSH